MAQNLLSLVVLPGDQHSLDHSLDAIYVGETVTICLVIDQYNGRDLEGLSIALERFCVAESRRLYSDSTSNIDRMRSVDSLLSDDGHYSAKHESDSDRVWRTRLDSSRIVCTRPFTAQPLSDDSLNLHCKFVVSVKQIVTQKVDTTSDMDPFVMQYMAKEFGGLSEQVIETVDLGSIELPILLCNPVRVNKRIVPITTTLCSFFVDIESTEEDTMVELMSLQITSAGGPIQTGTFTSQPFACSCESTNLPRQVGAFGDTFEWRVQRSSDAKDEEYKSKLVVVVEPEPKRKCTLTFESPFLAEASFLPPHSDNFTVEFACEETTVRLGDLIRVNVTIKNRTDRHVDLSFKFPLTDKRRQQQEFKVSDPKNVTADQLLHFIKAKLATFPGFVCMEAERSIGILTPSSLHTTHFEYEAIVLGRQHIPTVKLVDNKTGKTVDFNNFLELTVIP